MDEILEHFEALEDPRSSINRCDPLPSVIVIAILGLLTSSNGPTSIADWASDLGLSLRQIATEEKPNGITATQLALSLIDLKGAIVTIDPMGTQTNVAQKILDVDADADYVLAFTGNQGTLSEAG